MTFSFFLSALDDPAPTTLKLHSYCKCIHEVKVFQETLCVLVFMHLLTVGEVENIRLINCIFLYFVLSFILSFCNEHANNLNLIVLLIDDNFHC